jgi:hypothetical protein
MHAAVAAVGQRMKLAIVISMFSVTACATTKTEVTAPVPAIKAPLDSLSFYVGNWTCKGTTFPTKEQKEEHWDARIAVVPELDGTWLGVRMTGPGTNRTVEHKGYDPVAKKWVHVAVGIDGSWGIITSPGWSGKQMVFDDANEHTVTTFTHIDERHYSHAVASQSGERLWEKVCTKV